MIINIDNYRINEENIKRFVKNNPDLNLIDLINRVTLMTSCPCIVSCYLIGEIIGFNDDLNKIIKSLTDFYQYSKIEGIRENNE